MKYAIIAAGEGSRLAGEGVQMPKPLVEVGGERLIDRLIRIFSDNGAEEIVVICNDKASAVGNHLAELQKNGLRGRRVPLSFIVKSTPSSMHSLYEMSTLLDGGPFCLTTVDTIFDEKEFAGYISAMEDAMTADSADGLMGVTAYVDDEKPLYISTDGGSRITGFHDEAGNWPYVSGGIYGLSAKALQTLRSCIARGESRMRNFQRAMVADGLRLKAFPFSKILDVDHRDDIAKAEEFLRAQD